MTSIRKHQRLALLILAGIVPARALIAAFFQSPPVSVCLVNSLDILRALLAAAACLVAARIHAAAVPDRRNPWMPMGSAFLAYAVGDVLWFLYDLRGLTPVGTPADVAYMLFYPLMIAGVLKLRQPGRQRLERLAVGLDLGIMLAAGFALIWTLMLRERVEAGTWGEGTWLTALAYPFADLVLIWAALFALLDPAGGPARGVGWLLTGGAAIDLLTNLCYAIQVDAGGYHTGAILDSGWTLAIAMMGAAGVLGWNPGSARVPQRPAGKSLLVSGGLSSLLVVSCLAGTLGAVSVSGDLARHPSVPAVLVGALGLVGLRQVVGARLAAGLQRTLTGVRDTLEQRVAERTEHLREARDQARAEEARFRTLADCAPVMIGMTDLDGNIVFLNRTWLEFRGRTLEEEAGWAWAGDLHPEDAPRVREEMGQALAGRKPYTVEYRIRDRHGVYRWVLDTARPYADPSGTPLGYIGTAVDITDRRAAEQELRRSREMLRLVLDAIPVRVFWKDRDGVYLGGNALFAADAGLAAPEDLIGLTDDRLAWAEQAGQYRADDREVVQTGRPKLNYEEPQTGPGGRQVWLRTSKIPLRDAAGEVVGVLGTYEDVTDRKLAEEAIRESEERYRLVFESAGDAIFLMDQDRFVECNPAALRMFGATREQLLQALPFDFSPEFQPDGRRSVEKGREFIARVYAGQPQHFEWRHCRYDRTEFDAEVNLTPVRLGGRTHLLATIRDVTARKRQEQWLASRVAISQRAQEATEQQILQLGCEEAVRLTGSEIGYLHFVHEDQQQVEIAVFSEGTRPRCTADAETHYSLDAAGVWADCVRQRRPVVHNDFPNTPGRKGHPPGHVPVNRHMSVPLLDGGRTAGILGVGNKPGPYTDADVEQLQVLGDYIWSIVQRKRAEESLQRLSRQNLLILESAGEGIFGLDLQGRITFVNPAAAAMLGEEPDRLVGRDHAAIVHRCAPEGAIGSDDGRGILEAVRQGAVRHRVEGWFRRSDGGPFPVEYTCKPIREGDRTVGAVVTFDDITARREAQAALDRLNRTLEAKNEELESMVYVTSHDLRSPLVNIQGFGKELLLTCQEVRDLLAGVPAAEPAVRDRLDVLLGRDIPEALRFIQSGVDKMEALLAGLLRLSRLGRVELEIETIDMRHLVGEILKAMDYQIKEAQAAVEVEDLPACCGDWIQVNQLFTNLIDNAVKYRHPERPARIRLRGQRDRETAVYEVVDNGLGIAPEHQSRVFEVFHRLDPDRGPGEGLGLTVARRIVERHRGSIELTSAPGRGTTFTVRLPAPPENGTGDLAGARDGDTINGIGQGEGG